MSGPVRLASLAVRGAAMVSSRFWISWMRRTGLAGFTVASDGFLGWGEQVGLDAHQFPQLVRQVELVGRVPVVDGRTSPRVRTMKLMCRFSQLDQDACEFLDSLSNRQRKLVVAAVNYHSLIQPGRTLHYRIYMGEKWQYPRLTDTSTLGGSCTSDDGREPIGEFDATSTVNAQSVFSPHYFAGDEQLVDRNDRYILLTPDDATDEDIWEHAPNASRAVKLYNELEYRWPVAFDRIRELQRAERERKARNNVRLYEPLTIEAANASEANHHPWVEIKPGTRILDAPKAVIVAMHWLQAAGAERWGMETIQLAKEAGFLPIVLTDSDGHQPWITDPICDGALVIPLTQPLQYRVGDVPILRALFEQFDIRGIMIHHCQWMYDNAWWVKKYFPDVKIVDSLHIVEYMFQGGFPRESLAHDEWIDLHHVISPQLERWMEDIHHIPASKVVDAPLVGLTADSEHVSYAERRDPRVFNVAFVGRMSRQKRPDAFILVAKAMKQAAPGQYHFIMHGSGDMDSFTDGLIKRYGLDDVIERRPMSIPVSRTYADADVLLVSSVNEGITLTTIEAISAGIPVLSANVGSQETLVPSQGLLRRMTSSFIHDAKRALMHLNGNEMDRHKLWEVEKNRLETFSHKQTANSLFCQLLNEWNK